MKKKTKFVGQKMPLKSVSVVPVPRQEEPQLPSRVLTFGQKMVDYDFNPSKNVLVDLVKSHYAIIIDQMHLLRNETPSAEIKRLCSVAITEIQTAKMWTVKALTWKD